MPRQLLDEDATFEVRESDLDVGGQLDKDTVYTLRYLSIQEMRRIYNKHRKWNRRDGERVDYPGIQDDSLDACLVGWNVVARGQPAPCERTNKLKLPPLIQAGLVERAQAGQIVEAGTEDEEDSVESFRQPA